MRVSFCCADTASEPWLQGLRAALPSCDVSLWAPGDAPANYAVVWAPPQQFFDEQQDLQVVFNIGAGVDALLKLRSQPVGGYDKSIALILFDKRWAVMTQNSSECSVPTPVFNDEAAVPRVSGACRHLSPSASARCCTTLLCMLGTHPPAFLAAFFTPR